MATSTCGVLPIYLLQLKERSSDVCLTCIGQFFATLSLIYWPACLIIVCMYLNKHKGHSKKKNLCLQEVQCGESIKVQTNVQQMSFLSLIFLSWEFEVSSPFYPGIARYPAFNRSRTTMAVRCLCHRSNKRGSFQLFNNWQYSLQSTVASIFSELQSTDQPIRTGLMD